MDRASWLAERRAAVEQEYTLEGSSYDAGYDPATSVHREFVSELIDLVPHGGTILDVACGTAPYAGMILDRGRGYVGADQSRGMLDRARAKWTGVRFELVGLQELPFDGGFGGVMCTDAMENVPPEDWPRVVAAFRRALGPTGHAYLTVEEIDRAEIEGAFASGTKRGWPIVPGEVVEGDTAGYHFYPDRAQVLEWLTGAGFGVVRQEDEPLDGYGYHHLLLRAADA
ncbi:MAG: class I SAM-dependent methyltransferase [Actinomycetota bacterium]